MARLTIEARRIKAFNLVLGGATYTQIAKQLHISEDTLSRDLAAITESVVAICRDQRDQLLAIAMANYSELISNAWEEYHTDRAYEKDWLAGKYDLPTTETKTKTLAMHGGRDDTGPQLGEIGAYIDSLDDQPPSLPLEVVTKISQVRPAWRSQRPTWLKLILETTREMTELAGIKRMLIEHSGTVGNVTMTLEQWTAQAQQRRSEAEATLTLLTDDEDENG